MTTHFSHKINLYDAKMAHLSQSGTLVAAAGRQRQIKQIVGNDKDFSPQHRPSANRRCACRSAPFPASSSLPTAENNGSLRRSSPTARLPSRPRKVKRRPNVAGPSGKWGNPNWVYRIYTRRQGRISSEEPVGQIPLPPFLCQPPLGLGLTRRLNNVRQMTLEFTESRP